MTEHPILFSSEMVRAILEGRKTQTRRVIKGLDTAIETNFLREHKSIGCVEFSIGPNQTPTVFKCPYGSCGSKLWVRETFCGGKGVGGYAPHVDPDKEPFGETIDTIYKADDPELKAVWSPSIHMPRWASRILLEITDIRVERLQEISEEDCIAEGTDSFFNGPIDKHPIKSIRGRFSLMWDCINAARGFSFDSNPWVWVIEFRRVKK